MKMTKEIVQKISVGGHLTDEELKVAIAFYDMMTTNLAILGPHHHFAWRECFFILDQLRGYKSARSLS